jgi:hypothetical protein
MISGMAVFDELVAFVIGLPADFAGELPRPLPALREDMRLAKAGALYADNVALASFSAAQTVTGITGDPFWTFGHAAGELDPDVRTKLQRDFEASIEDPTHDEQEALEDLAEGLRLKAFWLPSIFESGFMAGALAAGRRSESILPLYGARTHAGLASAPAFMEAHIAGPDGEQLLKALDAAAAHAKTDESRSRFSKMADQIRAQRSGQSSPPQVQLPLPPESQLLTGVLGGLRAFPDADWDVILDVRERCAQSRTRLRAAISQASGELENASEDELVAACVALRRRVVAPALADIEHELDDLGVVPTLLRLTKDAPTVGTMAANLALAASDAASLGLGALAHGVASAPLLASAAREALHHRSTRRALVAQPYWILREVARRTEN